MLINSSKFLVHGIKIDENLSNDAIHIKINLKHNIKISGSSNIIKVPKIETRSANDDNGVFCICGQSKETQDDYTPNNKNKNIIHQTFSTMK